MGPLKGNVTGVGLQVHARTFLCLSCPSSSMFNNDASCGGEGGISAADAAAISCGSGCQCMSHTFIHRWGKGAQMSG